MQFTFNNSEVVDNQFGKNNKKIIYVNETLSSSEWDFIENELGKRMKVASNEDETYQLLNQAKDYAAKKDEKRFRKLLSEHAVEFTKNIFCNLTSTMLYNILVKLGLKC